MMKQFFVPQCSELSVIINQAALNKIYNGETMYAFGCSSNSFGRFINDVSLAGWLERAREALRNDDIEYLSEFYVGNDDAHAEYLYQLVPCGHCALCGHRKQADMVNRALLEAECYSTPPYFVTLTYDDDHLPSHGELRYKDVQNFFKRWRRDLDRKGIPHNIRYICAGEYGKLHSRPHYHLVIFNNPFGATELDLVQERKLVESIAKAWSQEQRPIGIIDVQQCHGGAVQYVTKYMTKKSNVGDHWIQPFVRSSIKNGGIGMPYLKEEAKYVEPSSNEIRLVSQHDGQFKVIPYGKYINSHLFPSMVDKVHWKSKECFRQLQRLMVGMVKYGVYSFDEALDLLEILRPTPHMRIRLSSHDVKEYPPCWCHLARSFRLSGMRRTFDELVSYLSDLHQDDADYYERLVKHKLLAPRQIDNHNSLALRYLSISEKNANQIAKEKL